jgi:hypothetical protein
MRSPCFGGIEVSQRAFLSMLEGGKFNKKPVLSISEQNSYEANEIISELGISKAASRLGLKKSSLKRIVSPPPIPNESYDESAPAGRSRRYLERNFGSWKVKNLDPKSRIACLEMKSGVTLSINVPAQVI